MPLSTTPWQERDTAMYENVRHYRDSVQIYQLYGTRACGRDEELAIKAKRAFHVREVFDSYTRMEIP